MYKLRKKKRKKVTRNFFHSYLLFIRVKLKKKESGKRKNMVQTSALGGRGVLDKNFRVHVSGVDLILLMYTPILYVK